MRTFIGEYMKKIIIMLLLVFCVAACFAQTITMFGVVDTSLVYSTYFRDTTAVRNYDSKRLEFQNEINELTTELRELQAQKLEYEKAGNKTQAVRLEAQITEDAEFLQEYTWAKNIELENLRKNLANSDDFYQNLYKIIGDIAEEKGYSMILDLQEDSILWYSPSVDITKEVISRLGSL